MKHTGQVRKSSNRKMKILYHNTNPMSAIHQNMLAQEVENILKSMMILVSNGVCGGESLNPARC